VGSQPVRTEIIQAISLLSNLTVSFLITYEVIMKGSYKADGLRDLLKD